MKTRHLFNLIALLALLAGGAARAQGLDEQLDQDQFLKGLAEYGLDDLLDYVLESSSAGDAALTELVEIAHLQAALADEELDSEARSLTIDRLVGARRKLIDAHPNDPRMPLWQADLAFNLLFLKTAQSALDLTIEFGIASEAQWEQMRAAANEALRLVDDATVGLSDEILDLEEDEDFAGSAAMQQRHRYLLQVEQRQRLPFLNAAAAYYSALAGAGADDDLWKLVAETLTPLLGELTEPWLSRGRSMAAMSLVRLGRYDEARLHFDTLLGASGADAVALLRARLGMVELLRRSEGTAAAAAALDKLAASAEIRRDPFTFLLICDQRFLDAVRGAADGDTPIDLRATTGQAAERQVDEAVRVYRAYLENDLLPLNAAQRQEVVAGRWRSILPDSIPLSDLPPEMALAQAERMAGDPQRQNEARALLESLLTRHGDDPQITPRVMLALASAHAARGQAPEAARLLMDAAARFPLSPRAQQSAEQAAALLSAAVLDQPDSPELQALYEEALALVVERFPQASLFDRWAYERGLLLSRQQRYGQAAHNFSLVASESDLYPDAAFQAVQMKWNEAQATGGADREVLLREMIGGAERVVRLLDAALAGPGVSDSRRQDLRYYRVAAAVRAAQAQRDLGEHDAALKRLEGLEEGEGIDNVLAAEVIDARISVLEALQRTEQIEADLKELAQRSPQRALSIITRIGNQRLAEARRLIDAGDEQAGATMARERIVPISSLGWSIAGPLDHSSEAWAAAGLCQAEALRLAGDCDEALGVYEQVLVWRENSAEATLGRSECLFAIDRLGEALPGFQRIAAASAERRDANFWLAELRILQIFDQAGRNLERIYPRIQRLRLIDGQLGGPRLRREFAVLEDRHAP